jgi:prepilin-type N-terminal cleavage/methylation domain-containing protein
MWRTPHTTSRAGAASGFTIIELLAVMFILAILGGLIVPAASRALSATTLRTSAAQVATGLRRARNLAIMSGKVHCVRIARASDQAIVNAVRIYYYRLDELSDVTPPPVDDTTWKALEDDDKEAGGLSVPATVDVEFADPSSGAAQEYVLFMPDGGAWRDGLLPSMPIEVMLDAEHSDYHSNTGRRIISKYTITVDSLTGRIDVSSRSDEME